MHNMHSVKNTDTSLVRFFSTVLYSLGMVGFAVTSYTFIENEGTGMVTVMGQAHFSRTTSIQIVGG